MRCCFAYNVMSPKRQFRSCVADECILLYGYVRRYRFAATRIKANSNPVVLDDIVGDKTAIRASAVVEPQEIPSTRCCAVSWRYSREPGCCSRGLVEAAW